jgi:hypothetical protein
MGYTTDFEGKFDLDRELDPKTHEFLNKLATTRRMKRNVFLLPKSGFEKYGFSDWGTEGEFFVDGDGEFGQSHERSIMDYNEEPKTQPGLWCQWVPTKDGMYIQWDGGEKFYSYLEWLEYIIEKVLEPRGYILNGIVEWQGEESSDFGQIKVENNKVFSRLGKMGYGGWR